MRIGTITVNGDNKPKTVIVEISTVKVFGGLTFAGLVGGLVTFFTFWLVTFPQNKNQREIQKDINEFQYINFVLRNENDSIRAQSLELLIEAEIINDPNGKIKKIIKEKKIPDWTNYKDFVELSK